MCYAFAFKIELINASKLHGRKYFLKIFLKIDQIGKITKCLTFVGVSLLKLHAVPAYRKVSIGKGVTNNWIWMCVPILLSLLIIDNETSIK